ncbi:unnamed protein product [Parascedosporium putredinis]|uniref:Uncharacterized protein n=1 Tax=Parascedosporium putredinis TaxID=1442378 RepID=A0A9P1H8G9_9PEZI|nr:unnamed protein product [Parascedosporium putredinis]CAI8000886.1 unnamed protein product [Parascedosporium putredinis]
MKPSGQNGITRQQCQSLSQEACDDYMPKRRTVLEFHELVPHILAVLPFEPTSPSGTPIAMPSQAWTSWGTAWPGKTESDELEEQDWPPFINFNGESQAIDPALFGLPSDIQLAPEAVDNQDPMNPGLLLKEDPISDVETNQFQSSSCPSTQSYIQTQPIPSVGGAAPLRGSIGAYCTSPALNSAPISNVTTNISDSTLSLGTPWDTLDLPSMPTSDALDLLETQYTLPLVGNDPATPFSLRRVQSAELGLSALADRLIAGGQPDQAGQAWQQPAFTSAPSATPQELPGRLPTMSPASFSGRRSSVFSRDQTTTPQAHDHMYRQLSQPLGAWGPPGQPDLFTYTKYGEWSPWIRLNRKDAAYYMTNLTKSQAPNNTIKKPFYRVAFDEWPRETGHVRDPFHNAGYMHLYCFERLFDLFEIVELGWADADVRNFPLEERNHTALTFDFAELKDAYQIWFENQRVVYHQHLVQVCGGRRGAQRRTIQESDRLWSAWKKVGGNSPLMHRGNLKRSIEFDQRRLAEKRIARCLVEEEEEEDALGEIVVNTDSDMFEIRVAGLAQRGFHPPEA